MGQRQDPGPHDRPCHLVGRRSEKRETQGGSAWPPCLVLVSATSRAEGAFVVTLRDTLSEDEGPPGNRRLPFPAGDRKLEGEAQFLGAAFLRTSLGPEMFWVVDKAFTSGHCLAQPRTMEGRQMPIDHRRRSGLRPGPGTRVTSWGCIRTVAAWVSPGPRYQGRRFPSLPAQVTMVKVTSRASWFGRLGGKGPLSVPASPGRTPRAQPHASPSQPGRDPRRQPVPSAWGAGLPRTLLHSRAVRGAQGLVAEAGPLPALRGQAAPPAGGEEPWRPPCTLSWTCPRTGDGCRFSSPRRPPTEADIRGPTLGSAASRW